MITRVKAIPKVAPMVIHAIFFERIITQIRPKHGNHPELMMKCLGARKKSCPKDSFIFYAGDTLKAVGIVLSGTVHVLQEDYWGNRNILAIVPASGIFGEAYACVPGITSNVSIYVKSTAEILFIDVEKILRVCPHTCSFHGFSEYAQLCSWHCHKRYLLEGLVHA